MTSGRHSWGSEMPASVPNVQNLVANRWKSFRAKMKSMVSFADVKPSRAEEVFKYIQNGDTVLVQVGPVCFKVTEKPRQSIANLFIAVTGEVTFEGDAAELRAKKFHTKVGYFLQVRERLKHRYGVHYDYDDELIAHPVYHSQMAPMTHLSNEVNKLYHTSLEVDENPVTLILANVRIPTAQMDPFAVFMQVCADHLVNKESQSGQKSAFRQAVGHLSFFEGACGNLPRFARALNKRSLRPQHWYESEL
jgi:hypothetical protein